MLEAEKNEADILRTLRSRYEREGYTFIAHPTSDLVPEFLQGFRPDALALSDQGSIIIEVKARQNPGADKNLARIAERVARHPDWKFEIYYAGNFVRPVYGRLDKQEIRNLLEEVKQLSDAGFEKAALVMAWATMEAIARSLRSGDHHAASAPMIPSEVIEWLAATGHIDNLTRRMLRSLIRTRNAVVHGEAVDLPKQDLQAFYSTLQAMVDELDDKQLA